MFDDSDTADNFPLLPMPQQRQDLDLLTLHKESSPHEKSQPWPTELRSCDGGDKLK